MFWRISLVELTSLSVFCSVTWKKNDDWMTNCRIFFRPGSFHVWQSWSRSYLSHFALSLFSSLLVCCNQRVESYFRSDPRIWNLSGASVLIASLIKVRVGARLNFLKWCNMKTLIWKVEAIKCELEAPGYLLPKSDQLSLSDVHLKDYGIKIWGAT